MTKCWTPSSTQSRQWSHYCLRCFIKASIVHSYVWVVVFPVILSSVKVLVPHLHFSAHFLFCFCLKCFTCCVRTGALPQELASYQLPLYLFHTLSLYSHLHQLHSGLCLPHPLVSLLLLWACVVAVVHNLFPADRPLCQGAEISLHRAQRVPWK